MDVPYDLINSYQKVRFFTDITYVNKVPFIHHVSKGTRLRASSRMTSLSKPGLKDTVNKIIKVCKNGSFDVKHMDAHVQFECMQDKFEGTEVDIVDAECHVGEVNRTARESKEGIRGIAQGFLFRSTPRLIVR